MRPLRVLVTADPYLPVPPVLYGGIERIIALLIDGLVKRGHAVTLIAHPGSSAPVELVPYGIPPHTGLAVRSREIAQVWRAIVAHAPAADIVHSFGRLAGLGPILGRRRIPKIQCYSRARVESLNKLAVAAQLAGDSLEVVGCSQSLFRDLDDRGPKRIRRRCIFNAIEMSTYTFEPVVSSSAPLVFLGRLDREKGPHHAIAIARRAQRKLVLAGNVTDRTFFAQHLEPHIDDDQIRYIGPVDDAQKSTLLGTAAALLMPIEVEEAFGLVMVEAFACGTPVIAFDRGAIREIVRHGETGFVCNTIDEATRAVAHVGGLDRKAARLDCERRFSSETFIDAYEELYRDLRERCASSS